MRRSDFFDRSSRHWMFSGPTSTWSMRSKNILIAELAVEPMRTAGAALIDQHDVAIAAHAIERRSTHEVYRSTAEVPGPPAIRNSGSGALLRLIAGTRATNSSILRPSGSSGFSATSKRAAFGRQRQHARRDARAGRVSVRVGESRPGLPAAVRTRVPPEGQVASCGAQDTIHGLRPEIKLATGCARNSIRLRRVRE